MLKREWHTMDGNTAAAHSAYMFSEIAPIYPITPSTRMAELVDEWAEQGKENIWGHKVKVVQMQSEAGVAGALHGGLVAGALGCTFTSSQGLLLMIPNMFKLAGELLPAVIHVAARTVATHALSIFGDHSDVYSCRQTGFAMLASSTVQEAMDLGAIAHLSAIKGRVPFLHFFDGFRTSHEVQKIEIWNQNDLKGLLDCEDVAAFRRRASNPEHPSTRGTAQNPDVFFQMREAQNSYYNQLPNFVANYMDQINSLVGTNYSLFNYYGDKQATDVVVAMGSVCGAIEEAVDFLNLRGGHFGLLKVRLFRPFSIMSFLNSLPKSVKRITVLDRTKEPGAVADPLFLDVAAAISGSEFEGVSLFGGRYGLSSKDTTPEHIISVFENSQMGGKKFFTLGIIDDVTYKSLPEPKLKYESGSRNICCKFWGFGSDGTVGAVKNAAKIIGEQAKKHVQAYFSYDSKKSGGVTVSHLRFGKHPIKSSYLVQKANFVACHKASYLMKYRVVQDLKPYGMLLINCSPYESKKYLPDEAKKYIALNQIKVHTIDADKIAQKLGLKGRPSMVLQAAFLKLTENFSEKKIEELLKQQIKETFGLKGAEIVAKNQEAILLGMSELNEVQVPKEWETLPKQPKVEEPEGLLKVLHETERRRGDELAVSEFVAFADGVFPALDSTFEFDGNSPVAPSWKAQNCIACGLCSLVCPHAAIRPVALVDEKMSKLPEEMEFISVGEYNFGVTVSTSGCRGCGACVEVCPGKGGHKALALKPKEELLGQQKQFEIGTKLEIPAGIYDVFSEATVKGVQFKKPLLEFSGACAGCTQTPYAKLVTQLFGERMYIANATGCSSIWGASFPSLAYTKNAEGRGPAWANSLFEDNAEFGYGIWLAQEELRQRLISRLILMQKEHPREADLISDYLKTLKDANRNFLAARQLTLDLVKSHCSDCEYILENADFLSKKSVWLFGGDGWAYDIGFGGLDHVLASGANVNVLVFDTEVYSNTGGQASKATQLGAVARFAVGSKEQSKKDLAAMMMTYGNVYVAQIAMGANYQQCLRVLIEAESYEGPSLVIAYAPCINHGISGGMKNAQLESRKAVQAGYWHLFRFDPRRKEEQKNPFVLDSPRPSLPLADFLEGERRYSSQAIKKHLPKLSKMLEERYEELAQKAKAGANLPLT